MPTRPYRILRLAAAGAAAAALLLTSFGGTANAAATADTHIPATALSPAACTVPAKANDGVLKELYTLAQAHHVAHRVLLAEFEAAWVESHANNLKCGDADSVGVFQQRPSQGWCNPAKLCRDVKHATNKFLSAAITVNKAHPTWSGGHVAQAVQRSAYPDRYQESKAKAKTLIARAATL